LTYILIKNFDIPRVHHTNIENKKIQKSIPFVATSKPSPSTVVTDDNDVPAEKPLVADEEDDEFDDDEGGLPLSPAIH
jgi:hypothetical protein